MPAEGELGAALQMVLAETARALVGAQRTLDRWPVGPRPVALPVQPAVPWARVDLRFGLSRDQSGGFLFHSRRSASTVESRVHARFLASPQPPEPITPLARVRLRAPAFVALPDRVRAAARQVAESLDADTPPLQSRLPSGQLPTASQRRAEARRVREAAIETGAAQGLVGFRLGDDDLLVVRLGSQARSDGLYRVVGDRVRLHGMGGDGERGVSLAPLLQLLGALGPDPDQAPARTAELKLSAVGGLAGLLAHALTVGGQDTTSWLQRNAALGVVPTWFSLAGAGAELAFQLDADSLAWGEDQDAPLAASRARLGWTPGSDTLRLELTAPPVGVHVELRRQVIREVQQREVQQRSVSRALVNGKLLRQLYHLSVVDPVEPDGIQVLLSQRRQDGHELLLIWPGGPELDGNSFAFLLRRGEKVRGVWTAAQAQVALSRPAAETTDRRAYQAFRGLCLVARRWTSLLDGGVPG